MKRARSSDDDENQNKRKNNVVVVYHENKIGDWDDFWGHNRINDNLDGCFINGLPPWLWLNIIDPDQKYSGDCSAFSCTDVFLFGFVSIAAYRISRKCLSEFKNLKTFYYHRTILIPSVKYYCFPFLVINTCDMLNNCHFSCGNDFSRYSYINCFIWASLSKLDDIRTKGNHKKFTHGLLDQMVNHVLYKNQSNRLEDDKKLLIEILRTYRRIVYTGQYQDKSIEKPDVIPGTIKALITNNMDEFLTAIIESDELENFILPKCLWGYQTMAIVGNSFKCFKKLFELHTNPFYIRKSEPGSLLKIAKKRNCISKDILNFLIINDPVEQKKSTLFIKNVKKDQVY